VTRLVVPIFNPWDRLAFPIRCGKADVNAGTKMRTMNTRKPVPADHHQQYRICSAVSFVFSIVAENSKSNAPEVLRPVAVLARFSCWYESIARKSRRHWLGSRGSYSLKELTEAVGFAVDPACRAGRNVAFHTFHSRVRRVLIGGKLGGHSVTTGSAELGRVHVRYGAIGKLGSDQNVKNRGDSEKPRDALQGRLSIESGLRESFANSVLADVHANRNQDQACEKNQREDEEGDNSDIGIACMTAEL
jgi:hypothetical protein